MKPLTKEERRRISQKRLATRRAIKEAEKEVRNASSIETLRKTPSWLTTLLAGFRMRHRELRGGTSDSIERAFQLHTGRLATMVTLIEDGSIDANNVVFVNDMLEYILSLLQEDAPDENRLSEVDGAAVYDDVFPSHRGDLFW